MANDTLNANGSVNYNLTPPTQDQIDNAFRLSPMGSVTTAIGDNIFGINHRQAPSLIAINKDQFGLTFFTRPRLNLSSQNLRVIRKLAPLLSTRSDSYQRIIRCLLDPVGQQAGLFDSPWVDRNMPFIPILTNSLSSLPGWVDPSMSYWTSHEGVRKEQYTIADGTEEILRAVDLTANFNNMQGDMITSMFYYWLTYMRGVWTGELLPHPDSIMETEIDYQTRIYRLVLDHTKRFVLNIGCTGASFPTTTPLGAKFNYVGHHEQGPINDELKQVSVHFINNGLFYNDDIIPAMFNRTTELYFNPAMADSTRDSTFKKVAFAELPLFNYRGYPHINLKTYELEWYVRPDLYQNTLPLINQYNSHLGS